VFRYRVRADASTVSSPCRQRGLTLIELSIGLALMGILIAQALPDMMSWLARYRLSAQASSFSTALYYARSEAVTRGVRVTVCASITTTAASPSCSGASGWGTGWLVFVDSTQVAGNLPGVIDGTDLALRIGEPLQGAVVAASASAPAWVSFTADGYAVNPGGAGFGPLTICQRTFGQQISVNQVGRLSTAATSC
jgi:type IV fimbrial biogenesis protein FimT